MLSVFLIHIASLMSLPAWSDSRSITLAFAQSITWFSLQTWSVIADLLQICPGLFCSSEGSCGTIHFFTMFFYSCSQWPSCFSNVDTFTVFTQYLINHLWLFLVTDSVFGVHQGDWSRIRQSWQTDKGGDMDQEDRQHESRRGELPVEPRMGQAFTYWRLAPEVSPDEGFRREAKTSINSILFWSS